FLKAPVCIMQCLPQYLAMIHTLQSSEPFASTGVLRQILFIHRNGKCLFPFGILLKSTVFLLHVNFLTRFLSTESLNGKDQKGMPYIPHICRYLFLAYHKILWDSKGKYGVRMIAWIKYWYRGPFKYKKPSRKTIRNKSQKPKEDFDPS
ncbi:PREDICTED: POPTR_0011s01240g, partial [Prunus dulcis]